MTEPVTNKVLNFYEPLATYYHLIFEDWDKAIERQAKILDAVLARHIARRPLKILDCACGIGTQALGLAALGHQVVASDLTPAEVKRATREAETRGIKIAFHVSDMTDLAAIAESDFDVVAALDNALPHLTSDQLAQAIKAIAARLNSGGLFVASIRDYDSLMAEKLRIQEPVFYGSQGTRRIVHQVWDWFEEAKYVVHLYITMETDQGWESHHFASEYRCLLRAELSAALETAGFQNVMWLMPAESGYYQPIVLARWP
jgi:glycine/sarcosine N-methyltransferase